MSKITISTAIAYPNARPHLGHALEFIHADALSRFYRLSGYDVMFTTGVDEHGTKIYKTAKEEEMECQDLVDRNFLYFTEMCELLNIDYTLFLRTSDEMLKAGAQKLWRRLVEAGDLYKDSYKGLYCSGCENYMLEKDLVDGKCPNHMKEPEVLEEENYFFRLSKYIPWLKEHIGGQLKVLGEFRVNEIKNMLEDLKDVSFSRPKSVLPWGVPVPDDEEHVMYVWCDAIANYLTGLGYAYSGEGSGDEKAASLPSAVEGENFSKYWPTDINIIGKDIMKFHAIFWPAMLKSAGIELPSNLYVHGFVTSEGKKMGKSLGNVVDPVEYANDFGADALRYYLLSQVPTQDDGDFARDRFFEVYQAHLANNVGNLVSRVVAMAGKYFDGNVTREMADKGGEHSLKPVEELFVNYKNAFENYDLKVASEKVMGIAELANKFVDDSKPWELAKAAETKVVDGEVISEGDPTKRDELAYVLYHLLEAIRVMGVMLLPIIPAKAALIFEALGLDSSDFNFENMFESMDSYTVKKGEPLFPRLEVE